MRLILLTIFFLSVTGCAKRVIYEGCVGKSMDFAWTRINKRRLIDDIQWITRKPRIITSAIHHLGRPLDNGNGDPENTANWVYGAVREGWDCRDDKTYDITYFFDFKILQMTIDDTTDEVIGGSCQIIERYVITNESAPDPVSAFSIATSKKSCAEYISDIGKPQE